MQDVRDVKNAMKAKNAGGLFAGTRFAWLFGSHGVIEHATPVLCFAIMLGQLACSYWFGTMPQSFPWIIRFGGLGVAAMLGVAIASSSVLVMRHTHPVAVLAVQSAIFLAMSGIHTLGDYVLPPLFIALYAFIVHATVRHGVFGVVAVYVVLLGGIHWPVTVEVAIMLGMQLLIYEILVVMVAIAIRGYRQLRESMAREYLHREQAQRFVAQRDEAIRRSRIAAHLHDSVGHGLTTIIALSEGLSGTVAGGTVNAATIESTIGSINRVAHESLDETREAARQLARTSKEVAAKDGVSDDAGGEMVGTGANAVCRGDYSGCGKTCRDDACDDAGCGDIAPERQYYDWADIDSILDHVRVLHIAAVLSETGQRNMRDRRQADLCFAISREAITNAIRHGQAVSQITVSWDHSASGTMVTIRDDGSPEPMPLQPGLGLALLRDRVEHGGGTLEYGSTDYGWQVHAFVPASSADERATVEDEADCEGKADRGSAR